MGNENGMVDDQENAPGEEAGNENGRLPCLSCGEPMDRDFRNSFCMDCEP